MAIKSPAVPKAPEGIRDPKVDSYLQSDSKMIQSALKDIALQNNWQVISSDPTETPGRVPTIKLDTRGLMWVYFEGAWYKLPFDAVTESFTFGSHLYLGGNLYVNQSTRQVIGGFGAQTTTSGAGADWNHAANARSGNGAYLLLGNDTNGPGPPYYFHVFNFEYAYKDGTGNLTQFAVPYGSLNSINKGLWVRGRYSSSWNSWVKILDSNAVDNVGITIDTSNQIYPLTLDDAWLYYAYYTASGVAAQTATTGGWYIYPLNYEYYDSRGWGTLTSNIVYLTPGMYIAYGTMSFAYTNMTQCRIVGASSQVSYGGGTANFIKPGSGTSVSGILAVRSKPFMVTSAAQANYMGYKCSRAGTLGSTTTLGYNQTHGEFLIRRIQ